MVLSSVEGYIDVGFNFYNRHFVDSDLNLLFPLSSNFLPDSIVQLKTITGEIYDRNLDNVKFTIAMIELGYIRSISGLFLVSENKDKFLYEAKESKEGYPSPHIKLKKK